MTWHRSPEEGWAWHGTPSTTLGSSGPTRVETTATDPDHKPRPVGFTADLGNRGPATETEDIDAVLERVPQHIATLSRRCPECGDCDGYHYRSCSQHPKDDDPWL